MRLNKGNINHYPLSKYAECSCCGKIKSHKEMAYIKPDKQMETDYFPMVNSLCENCVVLELKRLAKLLDIAPVKQIDALWIQQNIEKIKPNSQHIEHILFLCSIIINKNQ